MELYGNANCISSQIQQKQVTTNEDIDCTIAATDALLRNKGGINNFYHCFWRQYGICLDGGSS